MNKEEILEAITENPGEIGVVGLTQPSTGSGAGGILRNATLISPEKLAAFLAEHLKEKVWDTGGPWVCEQHPDKPFLHDDCIGPGMPPRT